MQTTQVMLPTPPSNKVRDGSACDIWVGMQLLSRADEDAGVGVGGGVRAGVDKNCCSDCCCCCDSHCCVVGTSRRGSVHDGRCLLSSQYYRLQQLRLKA
mmetsp:Transcript_26911/g.44122  ORF Transcript_26911/g.44122 Transcript_26911/m.44122 type:complete len:99 (+) Transcript_26911:401-697(+)